ncbi:MAG: acyl carrier protein [Planctomycetes bacterium]|nr:acyl carrier protein [Planctomycetota bacterium]
MTTGTTSPAATMVIAVAAVLDRCLHLGGRAGAFTAATPLLGALPELDSLAVVQVITALQERFAIAFDDEDLSGETFATLGSLADLVAAKGGRP